MPKFVKTLLTNLFGSKKFVAAVVSFVAMLTGRLGLNIPMEDLVPVVGPFWLYIVGQALADHGKERAKVTAEALKKGD